MLKVRINTQKAPAAIGPYSQGVSFGDLIFLSGQLPINPVTGELINGIEEETVQVFENIKALLEKSGSRFDKVLKCTVFLKDMNDFAAMNEVYGRYFKEPYPAREAIQVARLPKDASIEISVIATR